MVTCPAVTYNNSSAEQQTGKSKRRENTQHWQNSQCTKNLSSAATWAKPSVWQVLAHDSCTEALLMEMQSIAKTEISPVEAVPAPPCPTTKIHRFGWYNCACAQGSCQPSAVNQGPHLFTPYIHRATAAEGITWPLLKFCSALWSFTSTAMQVAWFFVLPQHDNGIKALGLRGTIFSVMVYHVGGNFHWMCYHTAVSVITVIAPVSTIMQIQNYRQNFPTVSKASNSRNHINFKLSPSKFSKEQTSGKRLCHYALFVAWRFEIKKSFRLDSQNRSV